MHLLTPYFPHLLTHSVISLFRLPPFKLKEIKTLADGSSPKPIDQISVSRRRRLHHRPILRPRHRWYINLQLLNSAAAAFLIDGILLVYFSFSDLIFAPFSSVLLFFDF